MSTRLHITADRETPAPAAHPAKNAPAGAGLPDQPVNQSRKDTMVGRQRPFIGAYAHRFVTVDQRGRLGIRMAELDALVGELIEAAVAHELRAVAERQHREADTWQRVAESLTDGGEL